jgi:ketosteroid isomerase-like protein
MGSADTELLDRLYEAINSRDLDGILELCTEDSAWDLGEVMPDQNLYRGHDGIREYFAEIWPITDVFRLEVVEYHEVEPGMAAALLRLVVRGGASGAEIDAPYAALWFLRDGKAAGQKVYPGHEAVLEAAASLRSR